MGDTNPSLRTIWEGVHINDWNSNVEHEQVHAICKDSGGCSQVWMFDKCCRTLTVTLPVLINTYSDTENIYCKTLRKSHRWCRSLLQTACDKLIIQYHSDWTTLLTAQRGTFATRSHEIQDGNRLPYLVIFEMSHLCTFIYMMSYKKCHSYRKIVF